MAPTGGEARSLGGTVEDGVDAVPVDSAVAGSESSASGWALRRRSAGKKPGDGKKACEQVEEIAFHGAGKTAFRERSVN